MMKIHLINLNKHKNNIYNFLFYKDNLVYFYVLLYNIALLLFLGLPFLIYLALGLVDDIFLPKLMRKYTSLVKFLESIKDTIDFKNMFDFNFPLSPVVFDSVVRVFEESVMGGDLTYPIFTLITLAITYFQKDRIIRTSYYKLFKTKLIDLFDKNFTKYFLLSFVIFVFYLLVCLCIIFLVSLFSFSYRHIMFFDLIGINLSEFGAQIFSWFLPFLYSYFLISFWSLLYFLFICKYNVKIKCIYVLIGGLLFLSTYLVSPSIFLSWEGGIYLYNGSYNWYVLYKLSRYFIIYPILTSFFIGLLLSLFLYFIKGS